MKNTLKIGTRGSELALKQTELTISALKQHHPELETEVVIIRTDGDVHTDIPLCKVNKTAGTQDKGVFVAAIEQALSRGEIDCAVHSLKDVPGQLDAQFELSAILPREEIWDTLILKPGAKLHSLTIGTSSVRRVQLVNSYWSGTAKTVSIRGNVHTRLRKLVESPDLDGIILARAGLNRLGITGNSVEVDGTTLNIVDMGRDSFMPALCQGAIAVETRKGDTATQDLIKLINDRESELCVRTERAFLAMLQADCSVPVAGYAAINGDFMMFRAIYFTPNGMPIRITHRGETESPEQVAADAFLKLQTVLQG